MGGTTVVQNPCVQNTVTVTATVIETVIVTVSICTFKSASEHGKKMNNLGVI